jgi:hypothetical protein
VVAGDVEYDGKGDSSGRSWPCQQWEDGYTTRSPRSDGGDVVGDEQEDGGGILGRWSAAGRGRLTG